MNDAAQAVLAAYERGEISAEIAVMRLLLAFGDITAVRACLDRAGARELQRLAAGSGERIETAAGLIAAGLARERAGSLDAIRAQFDEAASRAPEAAVALYSLGLPDILDRATAEIVARLREWHLVGPRAVVLDIGCGIGRIELALAPEVAAIIGIDLSQAMVAEARRRCAALANVEFRVAAGDDLAAFAGHGFDLILAVDVFPYLVSADPEIAARHVADAARLVRPGGAFLILNYSYRGDLARDRADAAVLAARYGFGVERDGTRDFALWDGAAFLLRKPP